MTTITLHASDDFFNTLTDYLGTYAPDIKIIHTQITNKKQITINTKSVDLPVRLGKILDDISDLQNTKTPQEISFKNATLHTQTAIFTKEDETEIKLTEKECALLVYLHENQNTPVSRDDLLQNIWNYSDNVETHTIETHIYRLRQKIEDDPTNPQFLKTTENGYSIN